jgi:hypothetical protein
MYITCPSLLVLLRYQASQSDVAVYEAVKAAAGNKDSYGHVVRWVKHIESFSNKFSS